MKKKLYGIIAALACVLCMSVFLAACDYDYDDHSHNYKEIESERIEPTCTLTGTKFLECECGEKSTAVISALGHDYGKDDDKDVICKRCGRLNASDKTVEDTDGLIYTPVMGKNAWTGADEIVALSVDGIEGDVGRYIKIPGSHKIKVEAENGTVQEREYNVTEIGAEAFKGCGAISVYVPNNVTKIGDCAFADCESLVGITLPERSLAEVGADVFSGCTALVKIKYESEYYLGCDSNEYLLCIGGDAVTELSINAKTRVIADKAFYGNAGLKTLVIGDEVSGIGEQSFGGCNGIETVSMPAAAIAYVPQDSLKNVKISSGREIESGAFEGCATMTVLEIANTVRTVGENAFAGCDGIEEITVSTLVVPHIPNANLKRAVVSSATGSNGDKLSDGAFADCKKLGSVKANVKTIGKNAFAGCTALPTIELPEKVEVIGESAFKNCTALTEVKIEINVKSIGKQAFYGCESLTDITYAGNIIDWGAITFVDEYSTPICYGAKLHYKGISESFKDKR
ncbi:MAG: leucine-rich repeat domain-containing protein [Clostridiales bacterium]|nr:leucine-rich repeat domain-containing protein [Clostridiales bacterium]